MPLGSRLFRSLKWQSVTRKATSILKWGKPEWTDSKAVASYLLTRQGWPQAVIFDLDGTLIDSAADITAALNYALEKRGLSALSINQVTGMIGRGVPWLAERALREHGVSRLSMLPLVADFLNYHRNNLTTHTVTFAGTHELLKKLKAEGFRLGVCTNKRHQLTIETLKQLHLIDYFDIVLGARLGRPRKPNPAPLRAILDALHVKPSQAVMVGDSVADVECARAASVKSILVDFGYSQISPHRLNADVLISNLADVPTALQNLDPSNIR